MVHLLQYVAVHMRSRVEQLKILYGFWVSTAIAISHP